MKKEGIEVATQVATMIRARIKEVTGLNASAGISYCKFLTKIASNLNKPHAQAVITPRMRPIFVEALPLGTDKPSVQLAAARLELGDVIPTSAGAAATPDRIFRPQHCVSSAP